jgi:nucleoside-diphosphate-sugar epimerase
MAADVTRQEDVAAAVDGAAVVYMAAQPPYHRWPELFPPMLDGVIEATARVGAKLVMVDNLYAYGPVDGIMNEDTPEAATDRKGRVRHEMAQSLLAAHRAGRVRVAIGRASDYFGPAAENSAITSLAIGPAAAGKTMRWLLTFGAAHSIAYLPDVGRAFVALGTSDRADGRVWHLPHPPAPTGGQLLDAVARALQGTGKRALVSKAMLYLAAPFSTISRESLGIAYQWERPFVVDDTRFRTTFGFEPTPLGDAVDGAVTWYRERVTAVVG